METKSVFMTIKEVAGVLGVTPLTLRNWDKSGKLKALRHPINNYRVYKRSDIDVFLETMAKSTEPVSYRKSRSPRKLSVRHLDQNL